MDKITVTSTNRVLQNKNRGVHHNFDVSVIISLCDKYDVFFQSLTHNAPYFQRNGVEVILVVRKSDKERVLDLIKTYPFVNWQLIEADTESVVSGLNAGLKYATKKYVFPMEPEVEFVSDVLLQMRNAVEYYPGHYITSPPAPSPQEREKAEVEISTEWFIFSPTPPLSCGEGAGGEVILVERTHLQQINGFDESFTHQNEACHNACARLDMLGIRKLVLLEAQTQRRCNDKPTDLSINARRNIYYPYTATISDDGKCSRFTQTLYDWQNNRYAKELCLKYLQQFERYELRDEQVFDQTFKKILLCQAHNEERFLPGFLEDMTKYFDGIILLDDASTDNTWKLAQHDKMLLKVKKKRECFNDIQNRNILLDIASFFQTEWFSFMDIDERLDERFVDFDSFENDLEVHTVAYRFVHLWNDEETYKGDIPYAQDGMRYIHKMFRPIGRTQITTKKKLHFMQVPYYTNMYKSTILIKDYGVMNEADRKMKYERYLQEDKQNDLPGGYEYMLNNENLMKISEIE